MLPFAILGFVMKPLQLKGDVILIFESYPICTLISEHVSTGFSHTGSQNPVTSAQTSCPEAGMCTQSLIWVSFHFLYLVQQGS